MFKNNCKGVTLVEIDSCDSPDGIMAPIIYVVFIGGLNNFARGCNFIDQQYDIQDAIRQVRHDVQDAKTVEMWMTGEVAARGEKKLSSVSFTMSLPGEPEVKKEWKFADDSLQLDLLITVWPVSLLKLLIILISARVILNTMKTVR